ncbi:muconolactone Delta-isomerase family protein [Anaeromyxobacter terrae]|uniref:muconolactone Delta-isomerase family protein n=1 Tax=Anaeromyxobacter terrae TaxID=2925406 RepID=UPI001F59B72B|nr:muconolactone Delta-isomerase family protein [Anaeromyxobacter sp. SG22]
MPDRIAPTSLLGRVLSGALVGSAVGRGRVRRGHVAIAATTAAGSAFVTFWLRRAANRRLPNSVTGLVEDALVLGAGAALAASARRTSSEYLVAMTTHVPDGTSPVAVSEVRGREAARSRELAAQGHLLRLWRPPLQPGEWRTFGLFVADDDGGLEKVLGSMPLRVWRTDEVTVLSPHPNDPGACRNPKGIGAEFLTTFSRAIPQGTSSQAVAEALAREAARTRQLAEQGHLVRLWALPGQGRALGLWRAQDRAEMQAIVESLPLHAMMTTEITPLTQHPGDPATTDG